MGSIDWADVLRGALAFFLVVVGIGIAYVCFRLGGVLGRMSLSVVRVTDEVVPILNKAQGTVDGINLELARVDEIMVSAVNATKGAERTVSSLSKSVTAPVKKASGLAAAAKEAMATFRARRAAGASEADNGHVPESDSPVDRSGSENEATAKTATAVEAVQTLIDTDPVDAAREAVRDVVPDIDGTPRVIQESGTTAPMQVDALSNGHVADESDSATTGEFRVRRGPSQSQIEWALPKRRS